MVTYTCPHCRRLFGLAAPAQPGASFACPQLDCRRLIQFPSAAPVPAAAPAPVPVTAGPGWTEVTDESDESDESDEVDAPATKDALRFPGLLTPRVTLLKDETPLQSLKLGWREQLFGVNPLELLHELITYFVLGYTTKLVLTTHRLIMFEKKLLSNGMALIWLDDVVAVLLVQRVNLLKLMFGVVIGLVGLGGLFDPPSDVPRLAFLVPLVAGVVLALTAFTQALAVELQSGYTYVFALGGADPGKAQEFASIIFRQRHWWHLQRAGETDSD